MKRVLILATNLQQASYRVRIEALRPLLLERGIDTDVGVRTGHFWRDRALFAKASQYDAVLLQRKFLSAAEAARLRRFARKIVYDIDDALMYFNRPVGWVSRLRTARRYRVTARAVDHVVAGNQYLADHFRPFGPEVSVLPTVVDPDRYVVREHQAADPPVLVWIGSHSTLGYIEDRYDALRLAADRVPHLRLVVIADRPPAEAPLPVDFVPWSAQTECTSLVRGAIGIAPTPSDPWTLGKCGFKIVQYMAAGLPTIASPVGANAELVRPDQTGLLPETDADWADAVARLCGDAVLRRDMGAAARQIVQTRLSIAHAADVWQSVLTALTK